MFDDVLVPTDGSDCAAAALGYAEDLAERFGATLHVLCVVDVRALDNAPHREEVTDERTEMVERTCQNLSVETDSVERAVRTDVPHRGILDYASEAGVDVVVMGTHGRTGVERYLLGSVTEKVVRLSDVPVLTVRADADGEATPPFSDVLVPTDGSDAAAAAIGPALALADAYDARLHALSVVDTMALATGAPSEAVFEALEDAARSAVEAVEERAAEAGVSPVETAVEFGTPYRQIRSYVTDNDVDLVVMGTHGRGGIERYLLGSVAEKSVRTSPVPVMTVRRPE